MVIRLFAAILFDAVVLSLVLRLVARHEADYSFAKCAMVAAPVVVMPFVLSLLLAQHIGILPVLILVPLLMFPFAVYMVARFCWVRWPRAVAVVALFYAVHAALVLGIPALRHAA